MKDWNIKWGVDTFEGLMNKIRVIPRKYNLTTKEETHLVNMATWLKVAMDIIDDLGLFDEYFKRIDCFLKELQKEGMK